MEQAPTPVTAVRAIMSRRIVAIRSDCELRVAVELIGERFGVLGVPLGDRAPGVGCLGAEERH